MRRRCRILDDNNTPTDSFLSAARPNWYPKLLEESLVIAWAGCSLGCPESVPPLNIPKCLPKRSQHILQEVLEASKKKHTRLARGCISTFGLDGHGDLHDTPCTQPCKHDSHPQGTRAIGQHLPTCRRRLSMQRLVSKDFTTQL